MSPRSLLWLPIELPRSSKHRGYVPIDFLEEGPPVMDVIDPETGSVLQTRGWSMEEPARSTREFWTTVADTYDAHELIPLWTWTVQNVRMRALVGKNMEPVVEAANHAMACAIRCCGGAPATTGVIRMAFDLLPADVGWADLQEAVERLASAWEVVLDDAVGD